MRFTHAFPLGAATMALMVGASACGSSTGANTITITQAEAAEIFAEMSGAFGATGFSLSQMPAGVFLPARAAATTTNAAASIDTTVNCTSGGTVAVSGTVTIGATGASFNVTETGNGCQTTHFTVGGAITVSGSVNSTQTSLTYNEATKGSLDLTRNADGTAGTCAVNFTVDGSVDTGTFASTATAQGTICGINASTVVTN
jgi:hypothetical protein